MPSALHQTLVRIFESCPDLLRTLLGEALELPEGELVALPADVTDFGPSQLLADVVAGIPGKNAPRAIVIIEVQLQRDETKRLVWPNYVTGQHRRYECPVVLCIVALTEDVEAWARVPIIPGPGLVHTSIVLGPAAIPLLTAEAAEASIELAVLSALAHSSGPHGVDAAITALGALTRASNDLASIYSDTLIAALPDAARRALEELMPVGKYEYQTEFAKKHYTQGLEQGLVAAQRGALLAVMTARGIEIDDATRRRIETCEDIEQLERWVVAAAVADTIAAVFGE